MISTPKTSFLAVAVLLALFGCGDGTGPETKRQALPTLESLSRQPDSTVIGRPVTLQARALDANGNPRAGVEIHWQAPAGDMVVPAVDTTDALGISTTTLHVGGMEDVHSVLATTSDDISRAFLVHVRAARATLHVSPRSYDMVARQVRVAVASLQDASGAALQIPLRWGSNNGAVASVDSNGVITAHRAGTATIYVTATLPPFSVDSLFVNVRPPVPARLEIAPKPENLVAGQSTRFRAIAYDSAGRPIDARDIRWKFDGLQTNTWFSELFPDSSIVYVNATAPGSGTINVSVLGLTNMRPLTIIADPLIEMTELSGTSFCYGGITSGPSGRWYYASNVRNNRDADSMAFVRTGPGTGAAWQTSEQFVECNRRLNTLPMETISIDDVENLYVPTAEGVMSVTGSTGATRWYARIGAVHGNIAVSSRELVIAVRDQEVIALHASSGDVAWRRPLINGHAGNATAAIDETAGAVYVVAAQDLYGIDLQTGAMRWRTPLPNAIGTSIAIDGNGYLLVGSINVVHLLLANGQLVRSQPVDGAVVGSPLIAADGNIYVATTSGIVYGFTPAFISAWSVALNPEPHVTSGADAPVIDRDGTIYFGYRSDMHAVRGGRHLWSRRDNSSGWNFYWSIGTDGVLYAASHSPVFRLRTAGLDPAAPWPMTHRDPQRTARR